MKKIFSNLKLLFILYALVGVPLLWIVTITLGIGTYGEVLLRNVSTNAILSLLHLPFKLVIILSLWISLPVSAVLFLRVGIKINKKDVGNTGDMGFWIIYLYLAASLGSWIIAFIASPYEILGGFLSYLVLAYVYFIATKKLQQKLNKINSPE
ncbi:MAG: hypothetical protein WCY34_06430 [Candidatus Omnitrophota bacterium]|jgi:hypothetical protein